MLQENGRLRNIVEDSKTPGKNPFMYYSKGSGCTNMLQTFRLVEINEPEFCAKYIAMSSDETYDYEYITSYAHRKYGDDSVSFHHQTNAANYIATIIHEYK